MKNKIWLRFSLLLFFSTSNAQENDTIKKWDINADINFYFLEDEFLLLPVIRLDHDKLHLEMRYNYEDQETFSAWAGYNISGGNKLEYTLTPMIGLVAGNTNAIGPGLEASLSFKKFEFYTESEFIFDFESTSNNYYYNWSDLTYSAEDWWWLGISGQRLRSYNSELEFQRGFLIGGGGERWEINAYLFNIDTDSPFYVASFSYIFQ
jgi:hypothetical protein